MAVVLFDVKSNHRKNINDMFGHYMLVFVGILCCHACPVTAGHAFYDRYVFEFDICGLELELEAWLSNARKA